MSLSEYLWAVDLTNSQPRSRFRLPLRRYGLALLTLVVFSTLGWLLFYETVIKIPFNIRISLYIIAFLAGSVAAYLSEEYILPTLLHHLGINQSRNIYGECTRIIVLWFLICLITASVAGAFASSAPAPDRPDVPVTAPMPTRTPRPVLRGGAAARQAPPAANRPPLTAGGASSAPAAATAASLNQTPLYSAPVEPTATTTTAAQTAAPHNSTPDIAAGEITPSASSQTPFQPSSTPSADTMPRAESEATRIPVQQPTPMPAEPSPPTPTNTVEPAPPTPMPELPTSTAVRQTSQPTNTQVPVIPQSTDIPIPTTVLPTTTPLPTSTPVPPTDTPIPPTDTPVPPTNVPTDTPVPPTDTPVPPTNVPTDMPIPPTDTPIPSTNTPVPPTDTPIPPTSVPATPCPPDYQQPVDVVLVFDRSGSMKGRQIEDAKQAASLLIKQLNLASDQIGLVSFADKVSLDYPLSHDGAAVEQALSRLNANGGTNIPSGITLAHDELEGSNHNPLATKVLVLLSDGQARKRDAEALAAAELAKDDGVRIIAIGLGRDAEADRELLRAIASSEQDAYYQPSSAQLVDTILTISQSIHTCTSSTLPTSTSTPTSTPEPTSTPTSTPEPTSTPTSTPEPTSTLPPSEVPTEVPAATPITPTPVQLTKEPELLPEPSETSIPVAE